MSCATNIRPVSGDDSMLDMIPAHRHTTSSSISITSAFGIVVSREAESRASCWRTATTTSRTSVIRAVSAGISGAFETRVCVYECNCFFTI